ncbi:VOC family protein [Microbulbifer halophilus]|uniref:VOC family protein n=1 Tax=Microbulbifer halophilus TaxID=453963 RepID=A0ABW5E968_9GAMM|nr:VOC family protein [Microbulbifer halophilus]MCW8124959.1 VOC family protein [Microbulbifer halophilus]
MAVNPVPDGYHSVTPYLCINGAAGAIEFYQRAFGAEELFRFPMPDGSIGHAEIQIGDTRISLADDHPEGGLLSPQGSSSVGLLLYVEDVDSVFARAVEAGATVRRPLKDQFYGDRMGTLEDPFGHVWFLATHIEDVPEDELQKRAAELS